MRKVFLLAIFLLVINVSDIKGGEVININSNKQLFIDDYIIQKKENVKKTLGQPKKFEGNPIVKPEYPWELIIDGCSVIYDDEEHIFKMWYEAFNDSHKIPLERNFVCYAISKDGKKWEKPNLGIIDFRGKNNNIVLTNYGYGDLYFPEVYKDNKESEPTKRYKMVYWDFVQRDNPGMNVAFSSDGILWNKYEKNPVLLGSYGGLRDISDSVSDVINLMYDPISRKFLVFHKTWKTKGDEFYWKRIIGRTESEDFISWSESKPILDLCELDLREDQFYGMQVFYYEGLYIGLPRIYHAKTTATLEMQLAVSRDGWNWKRLWLGNFLLRGVLHKDFDGGMIFTTGLPLLINDELWFYYTGFYNTHEELPPKASIGLAILRKDGFVSIDAGEDEGYIITKPFIFKGKELYINADASRGNILVEVLDLSDKAIFGFSRNECFPINRDNTSCIVKWQKKDISSLEGKTVKLKFYLQRAKLFSFVFK